MRRLLRVAAWKRHIISILLISAVVAMCTSCAPNKAATDSTNALQTLINNAIKNNQTLLQIPKAKYTLSGTLWLGPATNLTIDWQGSTLIFTYMGTPNFGTSSYNGAGAITIDSSTNVTMKNLIIDFNPLPYTQGTVIGKASDGSWYDLQIDTGYPTGTTGAWLQFTTDGINYIHATFRDFDPVTRNLKAGTGQVGAQGFSLPTPTNPSIIRILTPGDDPVYDNIQVGDLLASSNWLGQGIDLTNDSHATLTNITMYSAPGAGVLELGGEGAANAQLTFMPGPNPAGATSARLLGVVRDGWHSDGVQTGANLHNCVMQGQGDDGVTFISSLLTVASVDATGNTVTFVPGRDTVYERPGDTVQVYDGVSGMPVTTATVSSVQSNGLTLSSVSGIAVGNMITTNNRASAGAVVQNCTFSNLDGVAVVMRAPNGSVINNTMSYLGDGGILVDAAFADYIEGPYPNSITITGNTMSYVGQLNRHRSGYWGNVGAISLSIVPHNYPAILGNQQITKITISSNTVNHSSVAGLVVSNASSVTVNNNIFNDTNNMPIDAAHWLQPGLVWGLSVQSSIFIRDSNTVTLTGNTVENQGAYGTQAIYIDPTATNVTVNGVLQ